MRRLTAFKQSVMKWGNKLDIMVDGGVRRGTQVLKLLVLGAGAVSFGRP
jgi:isopentenyl diphosphate isomerase/L-lactate dehydrogenase-like FMN-dependent dehydrogenase